MNLCFRYPIVCWNCACLITDSGGTEETNEEGKTTAYDKIAQAMGKMLHEGIKIIPPDINNSSYTFSPDCENDTIIFGLSGISNVGEEIIQTIINNRPYTSVLDFFDKVHPNKRAMLSLIKGGAFDNLCDRYDAMIQYIWTVCDKKNRLTLQNFSALKKYDLLPKDEESAGARKVYEFNRYLKARCKDEGANYKLDERAIDFLNKIDCGNLIGYDNTLDKKKWDKVYQGYMDVFRAWIARDKEEILDKLNKAIFLDAWHDSAEGNISSWEMESLCFYYHEHELAHVNYDLYNLVDFTSLPEIPVVDKVFTRGQSSIPIYKLNIICGTCIAKNKTKSTVYLLTTTGVVPVKFRKEYFSMFDRQISKVNADGTKTVIEKSWFNRGSMIIIKGVRKDNEFISKNYKSSAGHQLYHIDKVNADGTLEIRAERMQGEMEDECD